MPGKRGIRARASCPDAGAHASSRGPRVGRRRSVGRDLRGRRASGAHRLARRHRPRRSRRLCRRLLRRLRRRRSCERHLAGADVSPFHRRRRRCRIDAGDLPPPRRSPNSCSAPARLPRFAGRAAKQYLRDPFRRGLLESLATLSHAMPTGMFDNRAVGDFSERLFAAPGRTNDFRKLGASSSSSRPTSTPARPSPSAAPTATMSPSRPRSKRPLRCPACSRPW